MQTESTVDRWEVRPKAYPTLLVSVGAVGKRIASLVYERLNNTYLAESGGLEVLHEPASADDVTQALTMLAIEPTVGNLESHLSIREPDPFFLRLQLVIVGNADEMGDRPEWKACLEAFSTFPHPPEGMRVLFLLDAESTSRQFDVSGNLDSLLDAIGSAYEGTGEDFLARVVICHTQQPTGVRLLHPNCHTSESRTPDGFEERLAALLELHITVGDSNGSLLQKDKQQGLDFACLGGATAVMPRRLLLRSASQILASDLIHEAIEPSVSSAGDLGGPKMRIDRKDLFTEAMGFLGDWCRVEQDVSDHPEPKESKLKRLLNWKLGRYAINYSGGMRVVPTLAALGSRPEYSSLSAGGWPETVNSHWKEATTNLAAKLPTAMTGLSLRVASRRLGLIQEHIDQEVARSVGGIGHGISEAQSIRSDLAAALVRSEAEAGSELLPRLQTNTERMEPNLSKAQAPQVLEHLNNLSDKELLDEFQRICSRIPGVMDILGRSLVLGAGIASLGPWERFGLASWLGFALAGLLFLIPWKRQMLLAVRAREFVIERMSDAMGQQVYEAVQKELGVSLANPSQAAGTADQPGSTVEAGQTAASPSTTSDEGAGATSTAKQETKAEGSVPVLGAIPQLWRVLDEWTIPTLEGYDRSMKWLISDLRAVRQWPNGYSFGSDLISEKDPEYLRDIVLERTPITGLADAAVKNGLFKSWRNPDLQGAVRDSERTCFKSYLLPYSKSFGNGHERTASLGSILVDLSHKRWAADQEQQLSIWLCRQIDDTLSRSWPLARAFPMDPLQERRPHVFLQVPGSLEWSKRFSWTTGSSNSSKDEIPENSVAAKLFARFGISASPDTVRKEADHVMACLVASTESKEEVKRWLLDMPRGDAKKPKSTEPKGDPV